MVARKSVKKPKRQPKVVLQKIPGENEWIVWIGTRWAGVLRKKGKVWLLNSPRRRFDSRKEGVAWLVAK